jgi:hypothetical protein
MLLACSAYAFGDPGSVVVDIVGSVIDNATITSFGMEKVELEFVGSKANNTIITLPAENAVICPEYICHNKWEYKEIRYPWESRHLGVYV